MNSIIGRNVLDCCQSYIRLIEVSLDSLQSISNIKLVNIGSVITYRFDIKNIDRVANRGLRNNWWLIDEAVRVGGHHTADFKLLI